MKFRALFTLEILWTLIFPLSGLAKRSPTEKEFKYYITHNILPLRWLKYFYHIFIMQLSTNLCYASSILRKSNYLFICANLCEHRDESIVSYWFIQALKGRGVDWVQGETVVRGHWPEMTSRSSMSLSPSLNPPQCFRSASLPFVDENCTMQ